MRISSLRIYLWSAVIIVVSCFSVKADTPATVISGVPAYAWYHGCVPTSIGMVMGYWDMNGCPNLFDAKGSLVFTESNVQDQISSPAHNLKYDPTPDNPSLPVPPMTSIADFCYTSVDTSKNGIAIYGGTWGSDEIAGITGYLNYRGSAFSITSVGYSVTKSGSNLWIKLVNEINSGRPMLFDVDDGSGLQVNGYVAPDHTVPAIGYKIVNGVKYYACYTTGGTNETPSWYQFQFYNSNGGTSSYGGSDVVYGVGGGDALDPTELTFSSTGLASWTYPTTLSNSMSMSVTNSPGFHATIPGSISGTGSLTLVGGGELILSGTNTYTGGTFVDDGTLVINSANSLPSGSSLTVGAGGTMIFDSSFTGSPVVSNSYESRPSSNTESVPEPSTIALLISGLIAGGLFLFRKQKQKVSNRSP